MIIDVETTGLDPRVDEVVEMAVVLFAFDRRRGLVHGVLEEYSGFREPTRPIPRGATQIHGITDNVVKGERLDVARIVSLVDRGEFVVAHNASFDRRFVSRLIPVAATKRWLCSMMGINWYGRGHTSRALQVLLRDYGLDSTAAHRALDDAKALLMLLSRLSPTGETNLRELLRRARRAAI